MGTRVIKSENIKVVETSRKAAYGLDGAAGSDPKATEAAQLKAFYAGQIATAAKEAHEKGRLQGMREGREQHKMDVSQQLQAVETLLGELAALKANILENAEEQMLNLVFDVAGKVIHMEVSINRDVVLSVLKAGIKNIVDRENMKIRLHPQDYQYMMEIRPDFLRNFDGLKNVVFEADASLVRGGAIIESMFGEVDARLDHQYNEIKTHLTAPPQNS